MEINLVEYYDVDDDECLDHYTEVTQIPRVNEEVNLDDRMYTVVRVVWVTVQKRVVVHLESQ